MIKEHNALLKKYYGLVSKCMTKKKMKKEVESSCDYQRLKKLFRSAVTSSQRDRSLVLLVLLLIEKKQYEELMSKYGYGRQTIAKMNNSINSGNAIEVMVENKSIDLNDDEKKEDKFHENRTSNDTVMMTIVRYVESLCEMYPLFRRSYTHFVRSTNTTILSLYKDFIKKHDDHYVCQSTFYNIFNKYLSHVQIPTYETEFCSLCSFY